MLDNEPEADSADDAAGPGNAPSGAVGGGDTPHASGPDASLVDDLGALIDDGRTYAEAEMAFQKTRAALAGKSIGLALAYAIVAIILLHIALLALAVGMVMALETVVGIWGAIAIVVGVLLLATGMLGYFAARRGKLVGLMFGGEKEGEQP